MAKVNKIVELERCFIARTFMVRGGKKLAETFVEAKGLGVNQDWFIDPFSKLLWLSAEDLFKKPDFNKITLAGIVRNAGKIAKDSKDKEIKETKITLSDLEKYETKVASTEDISSYVKELQNAMLRRSVDAIMTSSTESMIAGDDVTLAISKQIKELQTLLGLRNPCHKVSISELCDKALKDWDEAYHQRVELGNYEWTPGIPLPWRKLSYAINGFTPDMTVLAARPGVGKTACALNFARYWLDMGLKVSFVSVDMSPIGFVKRQLSERSRISSRQLQFGKSIDYPDLRQKVEAEILILKELEKSGNFTLYDEYDIDAIKTSCTILKDQGMIDVLIVDYLQLLKFKGCEKVSQTAKATYISNSLHEIAVTCHIPVLCLSQLNRDNTKEGGREPMISDLRDSGAIEQDAANVILLHRNDHLYNLWQSTNPPRQFGEYTDSYRPIWMIVAKAREGDEGTKIPFVAIQNKCAWYCGDCKADGDKKFDRVYDDWRHDPIEQIWEKNGGLIKMDDERAVEIMNINLRRKEKGLPPIGRTNNGTIGISLAPVEKEVTPSLSSQPLPPKPIPPIPFDTDGATSIETSITPNETMEDDPNDDSWMDDPEGEYPNAAIENVEARTSPDEYDGDF